MSKYRQRLPQLQNRLFMTDGGLETTLIYHEGIDLQAFAAFDLLKDQPGLAVLRAYFVRYAEIARSHGIGRLPSGDTLEQAIAMTDAATGGYPAYYMINCAHPTHFEHVLLRGGAWRERIRGLRANASKRSHAELDRSTDLDAGDPVELGSQYRALRSVLPQLSVVGGCCGTDHRHVHAICEALSPRRATSSPA